MNFRQTVVLAALTGMLAACERPAQLYAPFSPAVAAPVAEMRSEAFALPSIGAATAADVEAPLEILPDLGATSGGK
jgi:predicted small lipoprotein YifL